MDEQNVWATTKGVNLFYSSIHRHVCQRFVLSTSTIHHFVWNGVRSVPSQFGMLWYVHFGSASSKRFSDVI